MALKSCSITRTLDQVCPDASKALAKQLKAPFTATSTKYSQVLRTDFPGYNNFFSPVFADFQFVSSAKLPPHVRSVMNRTYG